MKVSELKGRALDWAVVKASGWNGVPRVPAYSTDWAQGGPIIERERITIEWLRWDDKDSALGVWGAQKLEIGRTYQEGFSPLIAAMRCFVASKLGDEVDIPEELV